MKNLAKGVLFVVITSGIAVSALAGDGNKCAPPGNVRFKIATANTHISKNKDFIIVAADEEITFDQSLRTSGTITWDYGDYSTDTHSFSDGLHDKFRHKYPVPGVYQVKLTASRNCPGVEIGGTAELEATVYVYDASLAEYTLCRQYANIPSLILRDADDPALIALITLLRDDRVRKRELRDIVLQTAGDLERVWRIDDTEIRKKEFEAIIARLDEGIGGKMDNAGERKFLDNLKTALTRIAELEGNDKKAKCQTKKDAALLKDLVLDLEEQIIDECGEVTGILEKRLRYRGRKLVRQINELEASKQNKTAYEANKTRTDEEIARKKDALSKIHHMSPVTTDELYQTFDDYSQFAGKFYAGYEFAAVNNILRKGLPRIGLSANYRGWERPVADADPESLTDAFDWYGVHSSIRVLVTGSAEQETSLTSSETGTAGSGAAAAPSTPINTGDDKALEAELELFAPIYRTPRYNGRKLWQYVGPVAVVGMKKVDIDSNGRAQNQADARYYAGLKFVTNPDLYVELLGGRSSSLQSKRFEFRAQMPVYQFSNETRLFLGLIGNYGVGDKRSEEADVVRVYATWNVNFESVYEFFSGKKMDSGNAKF